MLKLLQSHFDIIIPITGFLISYFLVFQVKFVYILLLLIISAIIIYRKIRLLQTNVNLSSSIEDQSQNLFLSQDNKVINKCKEHVGVHMEKGRRGYMEDAVSIYEDEQFSLYSVFDGHGGRKAAIFAANKLHHILLEYFEKHKHALDFENCPSIPPASPASPSTPSSPSSPKSPTPAINQDAAEDEKFPLKPINVTPRNNKNSSTSTATIPSSIENNSSIYTLQQIFKEAFANLDEQFLQSGANDGSTAVCLLKTKAFALVAHVGDSRCVLATVKKHKSSGREQIEAIALSIDHKPNTPCERKRIQDMGGFVINLHGTYRVNGLLATSRAIGDAPLKPVVSCEPDVTITNISGQENKFLVIASDGLFESMENQAVVEFVYEAIRDGQCANEAAKSLVLEAIARGSSDNVSAIVCIL